MKKPRENGKLRPEARPALADLAQTRRGRVRVRRRPPRGARRASDDRAGGRGLELHAIAGFTLAGVRGRLLAARSRCRAEPIRGAGVEIVARGDATVDRRAPCRRSHPLTKHLRRVASPAWSRVQAKDGLARVSRSRRCAAWRARCRCRSARKPPRPAAARGLHPDRERRARPHRHRARHARARRARPAQSRHHGDTMQVQRTAFGSRGARPGDPPSRAPGTLFYGALRRSISSARCRCGGRHPGRRQGGDSTPTAVEVKSARLLTPFGRRFSNVALRASSEAAGWSANVKADEVAGDVRSAMPAAGRLIARLARFTIPADAPAAAGSPAAPRADAERPAGDRPGGGGVHLPRQAAGARRAGGAPRRRQLAHRIGEHGGVRKPRSPAAASGTRRRRAPTSTFDLQAGDTGGFLARVGYPDLVRADAHARHARPGRAIPPRSTCRRSPASSRCRRTTASSWRSSRAWAS